MKVLVIDVGGTHVKLATNEPDQRVSFPSGPDLTAEAMVTRVKKAVEGWSYDAISIGYPGVVLRGRVAVEPRNLGRGWVGFDFYESFGCPVKVVNDAAMQALGSYEGSRMLFLGLGTGLGSALIVDGALAPLELGHLPYRKGNSFEHYVGVAGLKRLGKRRWRRFVTDIVERLKNALEVDYVVLGGGNARHLKKLPAGVRLGDNSNAFVGGYRLWLNGRAVHEGDGRGREAA
jgi:predicted NBD/HSP70 family sugar kinase